MELKTSGWHSQAARSDKKARNTLWSIICDGLVTQPLRVWAFSSSKAIHVSNISSEEHDIHKPFWDCALCSLYGLPITHVCLDCCVVGGVGWCKWMTNSTLHTPHCYPHMLTHFLLHVSHNRPTIAESKTTKQIDTTLSWRCLPQQPVLITLKLKTNVHNDATPPWKSYELLCAHTNIRKEYKYLVANLWNIILLLVAWGQLVHYQRTKVYASFVQGERSIMCGNVSGPRFNLYDLAMKISLCRSWFRPPTSMPSQCKERSECEFESWSMCYHS